MSVYKRKDGRWQATYRDYQGKVRSKTFPKGRKGKTKAEQFEATVYYDKAHERPLPQTLREGLYLDDLLQEWVNAKTAQGCSMQWVKDWVHIFNTYLLEHLTKVPAHALTQDDILTVINAYWGQASQTTRNRYLEYLKTVLEFGVKRGHLQVNPLRGWTKGKERRRRSQLTLEDLRRIQDWALTSRPKTWKTTIKPSPHAHLAWAIEVAWNVPVRPGRDLYGLTFDRVNYDRGGIEVYHSKVNKHAFVQCSDDFMRELWTRQQRHGRYLIEYKGRPVKSLKTTLKHAASELRLPYSVTMYDIRHLWITCALDQGLEMSAIAYIAGTSVEMIQRNYYEPHRAERNRAVEIMPRLGNRQQSGKVISIGGKDAL